MFIKCTDCNGTGQRAFVNGRDFKFCPGLSSVMTATCPTCDGMGKYWISPYWNDVLEKEVKIDD